MRYLFGFICVLALGVGCETTGADGMGGDGGGGMGGDGGGGTTGQEFPCSEQGIRDAIADGGGPHTFDCDGPQTIITTAEIVIDNDARLDGEGNLTLDGNVAHRVLSVPEGVTAELRGLTVTIGYAGYADLGCGAGIANQGTLSISETVVSMNQWGWAGGRCFGGGGIYNEGEMTIINSTISKNTATHGGGGGISNACSGRLTLVNSSISENQAAIDGWGLAVGGGIDNRGEMTIVNSTVSGNEALAFAPFGGGGIANSGWMSVTHSTVSGNIADEASAIALGSYPGVCPDRDPYLETTGTLIDGDCGSYGEEGSKASWISDGYNIESPDDTCGFDTNKGDQVGVSPAKLNLGPLQNNGGPTMTHLPGGGDFGDGSAAIDWIPEADCAVDTDQRGEERPVVIVGPEWCDVGSVEVQP